MADLLLKATPALLEGWCGPVVLRWKADWLMDPDEEPEAGVVIADPRFGPLIYSESLGAFESGGHEGATIYLDLSRAECQQRACAFYLRRTGERPGSEAIRLLIGEGSAADAKWLHANLTRVLK